MKKISKKFISDLKKENYIKNEKNIFQISNYFYITKLFYSFQDNQHLYLIIEFIQGGFF